MPTRPTYTLDAPAFRFRSLAALAGRAPMGGPREVALACFMAARLAAGAAGANPLPQPVRQGRATGARAWFASIALPANTRVPFTRLAEATANAAPPAIADALAHVIAVTAQHLDAAAHSEIERLIAELRK